MANQPWLDEVRERLAWHALPPAYIRRFMEELFDHFQDITEETMSVENDVLSRLGEPNQVAEAAICEFQGATVETTGRWLEVGGLWETLKGELETGS